MTLLHRLALALTVVSTATLAADKKAETELRWALNACGQVIKELERAKEMSGDRASQTVLKAEDNYKKFQAQVEKAKAIDPAVLKSETVFNKKDNLTFGQMYEKCLPLAAEFDAARKQQGDAETAKVVEAAAAVNDRDAERVKGTAVDEANSAIKECAIFKKWQTSGDFDDRLARYEQHKKAAVAALATVTAEKQTVRLLDDAGGGAETTKTVGEWFTFCDQMMPEQAAKVRAKEKATAAAEQADSAKRNAYNDRVRAEQEAKFNALVASTSGDRKRILQSKGYLPSWPRGGDLKGAPVWRWEVNITHEAPRCESFQFSGDKLTKNTSALGGCG